ncbi:MAG: DMT family transporter [Anaerolineaceae bacterium]|nr:DMT family transporter [Anaerolineaceae bacterium]
MVEGSLKKLNYGYVYAFFSAITGATSSIFIRHLLLKYQLPPLLIAFWRDFAATLLLWVSLLIFKKEWLKLNRRQILFMLGYGLLLAVFNIFWTFSVAFNTAAIASVLVYSSVGFGAFLGVFLLAEKLTLPKLFAVILTFFGCFLISTKGQLEGLNLTGLGIGLASGLCYAFTAVLGKQSSRLGINPWATTFYMLLFASCFLLLVNVLPLSMMPGRAGSVANLANIPSSAFIWIILLAIFPTVLTFGTYQSCLRYLESSVANIVLTFEPVFATIIAFLVLKEKLAFIQWLGGLIVVAAIISYRIYERERTRMTLLRRG